MSTSRGTLTRGTSGKYLVLVLTAVLLGGCAASGSAVYEPKGGTGESWTIDGDYDRSAQKITFRINGEPVLIDYFDLTSEGRGTLDGIHRGHHLQARCRPETAGGGRSLDCAIFVDGDHVADITVR